MVVLDYQTREFMLTNGQIEWESKSVGLTERAQRELMNACRELSSDPEEMFILKVEWNNWEEFAAHVEAYSGNRKIHLSEAAAYELRMEL